MRGHRSSGSLLGRAPEAPRGTARVDPDRLRERMEELLRLARAELPGYRLELYARIAVRTRVLREVPDGPLVVETGRDEGLAVRSRDDGGRVRFAATSGIGPAAVRAALAESARSPGIVVERPWCTVSSEVLRDHATPTTSPSPSELGSWLEQADPGDGPVWVEHGRTVEALVADEALRATRARDRVWAVGQTHSGGEERPRMLAARTLDELPSGFVRTKRVVGADPVELSDALRGLPMVLEPPESGVLLLALATALRDSGRIEPIPVGRGFRVAEDPHHPRGLAGGTFDDAGFPTRYKVLADGHFASVAPRAAGDLRRDSFRDPPRPAFGTLVVADGEETVPDQGIVIDGFRIHRTAPDRWLLEIDGTLAGDGRRLEKSYAAIRPLDWVRRICGAVGEAHACPNGVVAPTLLIDGSG